MHDAFSQGNWPLAHLLGELIAYNIHHQHFRQNEYGLNEYEWALVHYGFYGKCNEIEAIFGMSTNVLRQGSPTLRLTTNGLVELKKAVNNIKIDKDILCRAPYSIAEWQTFSEEQKEYIENNEWLESKHLSFLGNEDIKVKYRPN